MANRTLPFGYRIRSGTIAVVEDEAEIVRIIFASYEEGSSYEKLASGLNSRDIPFSPGRPRNKNAVARLLKIFATLEMIHIHPLLRLKSSRTEKRTPTGDGSIRKSRTSASWPAAPHAEDLCAGSAKTSGAAPAAWRRRLISPTNA